jgi:hypothetical protein
MVWAVSQQSSRHIGQVYVKDYELPRPEAAGAALEKEHHNSSRKNTSKVMTPIELP